ncbi:MAG: ribose-5-phosphate isomerase RpiA [Candidatus Hadarchaeota archaeon]
MSVEDWKIAAAEAAAKLVRAGTVVGLGSGTTVAEVVGAIARLRPKATFVPASSSTEKLAKKLGLKLDSLNNHDKLDLAIDGADEVDPKFNMIKGHGGAHTREKLVAAAAKRLVIVVDSTKLVLRIGERSPVPVEVLPFAVGYAERELLALGGHPKLRAVAGQKPFVTDNGNYILDVKFHRISDPEKLELEINKILGVVENGIFVGMADEVLVGHEGGCARLKSRRDFLQFMRKTKA